MLKRRLWLVSRRPQNYVTSSTTNPTPRLIFYKLLAELHAEMRKRELIDTLVGLLVPEEVPEVQDEAAFAISNLAKDCKMGFFKIIQRWLTRCIKKINKVANKADIRKAGGMKMLVKLLESSDPDVKKNAALALSIILEDCKTI
jgi:hypothetical protein